MISLLTEQKITEQVFTFVDESTIRELIPLAGERLLFKIKFKAEIEKIQNAEIQNVEIQNAAEIQNTEVQIAEVNYRYFIQIKFTKIIIVSII